MAHFLLPSTPLHEWALDPQDAVALQKRLASRISQTDDLPETVTLVAGIDVGFEEGGDVTRAAIVVMSVPELSIVEHRVARIPTQMPYVPGLLSFRELPAVLEAISMLERTPDLFMVDGQGIAHPRRMGIATHLGLWLERPTIGVGKSRLCGQHEAVPDHKGGWTELHHRGECIGAVLRTRERVKPLYISPGHRISLETSIEWVMRCLTRYKLPEPTRQADKLASRKPGATVALESHIL
ncbi:deoxyribonuclease V [Larsenimonas salina]|uniref:deoxyribonuclease V n=1 Tax=Larsenimonas salina TaxID=1295565 RepID=UPI0020733CD6|nr:deoxyribonuclease V [Larsenimonas salina]MCM5703834.1 deoxyribonuclease V [Larsenimonas salina]